MKAIETSYNGYKFRSRLEARWAVYFDELNLEYVYEPEGYQEGNIRYLPDFWLPTLECFAEVKPRLFTESEFNKTLILPKPCILLDSNTPMISRSYFVNNHSLYNTYKNKVNDCSDDSLWMLFDWSAAKKRLWFLFGEDVNDYSFDLTPEIKAKSARFEHDQNSTSRI